MGSCSISRLNCSILQELEDRRARDSIAARTAAKTQHVLAQTDIILLVVDARAGLMDDDKAIAREIRKTGKPIVLVGNKCEGTYLPEKIDEFEALGFGEPIPVSATHGEGMPDLFMAITPLVPGYVVDAISEPPPRRRDAVSRRKQEAIDAQKRADDGVGESDEEKNLHVAIVGRPNVGKSTLINRLIGQDRMLTGPERGLTRDAIQIGWRYKGKPVRLVDIATDAIPPKAIKLEPVSRDRQAEVKTHVTQMRQFAAAQQRDQAKILSTGAMPLKPTDRPKAVKVEMPRDPSKTANVPLERNVPAPPAGAQARGASPSASAVGAA